MKNSIGFQLFTRGLIILFFILSIAVAGRICILLLKKTSNKVFTEYIELDALQELKNELYSTIIQLDKFILYGDLTSKTEFEQSVQNSHSQLEFCVEALTNRHDHNQLDIVNNGLAKLDSFKTLLFSEKLTTNELNQIHKNIIVVINNGIGATEMLVVETEVEIDEFIQINNTAVRHSTITIISLGFLLLIIVTIGGILFIKKLTTPISLLLHSTKKVQKGKFNTTVEIDTNNEFKELAESFNAMTKTLEKTTISRNYYDSILKNMIEPLIVTDSKGKIKTINQIALNLLNYNTEELLDSSLDILFYYDSAKDMSKTIFKELEQKSISNSERILLTKEGKQIPVLVSTSTMNKKEGKVFRHIIVAHDLTEKKQIELKLDKERKEKSIAINDAHEEEKFRIAIDLHDGLGQILTAVSYAFQNFFGQNNSGNSEYQKNVNTVQSQIDAAIRESKNIAHNLIPIALKDFGLVVAINNLIEQVNQSSEIKFKFSTFNYKERINEKPEKAIFRIFQEAINNIIKHSKANNASFQINKYDDAIVLSIEDDGIGFDLNEKTKSNKLEGIGLIGMRERILAFNGNLTINTEPNVGTEILIEIPCFEKKYEKN